MKDVNDIDGDDDRGEILEVNHPSYFTSSHPFYATARDPVQVNPAKDVYLFHTVLDIACRNAIGMTDADPLAVVERIFLPFQINLVYRKSIDGYLLEDEFGPMTYWSTHDRVPGEDEGTTRAPPEMYEMENLLKSPLEAHGGDGTCFAWAVFFRQCIKSVGIKDAKEVCVAPNTGLKGFIARNCQIARNAEGKSFFDTSIEGIFGQPGVTPTEKIFADHSVVTFEGKIFDPSYGIKVDEGSCYDRMLPWQRKALWAVIGEKYSPDHLNPNPSGQEDIPWKHFVHVAKEVP